MRDIITKDLGDLSTQDKEALKHVRPANDGLLDLKLINAGERDIHQVYGIR